MIQKQGKRVYKKSNGCTKAPSLGMLLALLLMISLVILHALNIESIIKIGNAILLVLLAFNYITLVVVIYDYFILLIIDPVDPRLVDEQFVEEEKDKQLLVYCHKCTKMVHVFSYHCKVCRRCAEEFDHHCVFLNNCIAKKNYSHFFRLLLILSFHLVICIGQGAWVAVQFQGKSKWLGVSMAILAGLIFPQVFILMIFHCYISICLYKTTLQVIRGQIIKQARQQIDDYNPRSSKDSAKEDQNKMDTQKTIVIQPF